MHSGSDGLKLGKRREGQLLTSELTVQWFGSHEGFASLYQSFSYALQVASQLNRTLLLQPKYSSHFGGPNNTWRFDDIVNLSGSRRHRHTSIKPVNLPGNQFPATNCDLVVDLTPAAAKPPQNLHIFPKKWASKELRDAGFTIDIQTNTNKQTRKQTRGMGIFNRSLFTANVRNLCVNICMDGQKGVPVEPMVLSPKFSKKCEGLKNDAFGPSASFDAVHWRRGDRCRCKKGKPISCSGGCADPSHWLQTLRDRPSGTPVYVATNPGNPLIAKVAQNLSSARTWQGLIRAGAIDPGNWTALEQYICEINLMIHAERSFYVQSTSSLHAVVKATRREMRYAPMEVLLETEEKPKQKRGKWKSSLKQKKTRNKK